MLFSSRRVRPSVLENLESRRMLSVAPADAPTDQAIDNDPPRVVAVYANSTNWTPTFRAALEEQNVGSAVYGVETDNIPVQADQSFRGRVNPWLGINQISIQFDENVSVQQDDLTITGINQPTYDTTAFTYDPTTFTATWTLAQPVRNDVLTVLLEGSDESGVTDLAGNPLQGNCVDAEEPGGGPGEDGGTPARDYCELVPILSGDATRDGRVNALDLAEVRRHLNTAAGDNSGPGRYVVFADITGDGRINALDLAAVRQNLNAELPAGG